MRLALIGAGHQGKIHLRFLDQLDGVNLTLVVDIDSAKAAAAAKHCGVAHYNSCDDHIRDFDCAIIAIPTTDHFAVASRLIEAGKHVLIEKPVTTTTAEAEQLADMAQKQGVIAQVGFPERFNPAVRRALPEITKPLFIETHRLGVFSPRSLDIDVVLDLMIHDLDILYLFLKEEASEIEAVGIPILSRQIDIANARLKFPGKCVVNLTASRVSGKKMRKMRLFQPYCYLSVDFAQQSLSQYYLQPDLCNAGFPDIRHSEYQPEQQAHPLLDELKAFRDAIAGKPSDGVSIQGAIPSLRMALAAKARFQDVAVPPKL